MDPIGIEIRSLFGESIKPAWNARLCVCGVVIPILALIESLGRERRFGARVNMQVAPMNYFQLERLIEYFSSHPEDCSLLGTEKDNEFLVSLMKGPW
ncbi:hypothetical protein [Schaalia cardiffensis]|nr:hypothetical protein [Schaalia cardiffensis]